MQIPPLPLLSTPLQFSIKIQTEIDDLKGSHCWVPDRSLPLRQTFKRPRGCGLLSDHELGSPSPRGNIRHICKALSNFKTADVDLSLEPK